MNNMLSSTKTVKLLDENRERCKIERAPKISNLRTIPLQGVLKSHMKLFLFLLQNLIVRFSRLKGDLRGISTQP
jgi:hypothetical protein